MTSLRLSSGCLCDAFPRPWLTQLQVVRSEGHVEANEALKLRKLQGPAAPTADLDISLTIPAPVLVSMFLRLQCVLLSGSLASRHLLWLPQEAFPITTRTLTWRSFDWGSEWLYSACLPWAPEPVLCSVSSRSQWQWIKVTAQSQTLDSHPSLKTTKSLVDTVCLPVRLHCLLPGVLHICTCPTAIYFGGHAPHLLREAAWSLLTQPHL